MKADLIKYWSFDNSGGANRPVNRLNGLETKLSRGCSWFDQKRLFFSSEALFDQKHLLNLTWVGWCCIGRENIDDVLIFHQIQKTSKYHLICVDYFHKDDIKKITSTKIGLRKFQIPQFYPVCDQLTAELISKLNIKHFRTEYFQFSFSLAQGHK